MSCFPEHVYGVYVDGELPPEEVRGVEAHLIRCQQCRGTVLALREEVRVLRDVLRERRREPAPASVPSDSGHGFAMGFPPSLAIGLAVATVASVILDARMPSGISWLSPTRLFGVNEMILNLLFALRDRAPGLVEFSVAIAATAGLATLVTFLASVLAKRVGGATASLLLLAGMLAPAPPAHATLAVHLGEDVHVAAGEVLEGTLVVSGDSLLVEGTVRGDVLAFVERAVIRGTVEGSVYGASRELELTGSVTGGLVYGTENLRIDGKVHRNVYAGADRFTLTPEGKVGGDLFVGAEVVALEGEAERDLTTGAARLELRGRVGRDVQAWGDRVSVLKGAEVAGDLTLHVSDEEHVEISPGASIGGTTTTDLHEFEHESAFARFARPEFYFWLVIHLTAAFVVGVLLYLTVPGIFAGVLPHGRDFMVCLGIGFAALVLTPIALGLLALTLVGIPAAVIGLFTYVVALYVAGICVAALLGRSIVKPESDGLRDFGLALLVGLAILVAAMQLPFLGPVVRGVVLLVGLGMLASRTLASLRGEPALV